MDDPVTQEQNSHERLMQLLRTFVFIGIMGVFWALAYFLTDILFRK